MDHQHPIRFLKSPRHLIGVFLGFLTLCVILHLITEAREADRETTEAAPIHHEKAPAIPENPAPAQAMLSQSPSGAPVNAQSTEPQSEAAMPESQVLPSEPAPSIYAAPETLGEVTEEQQQMYERVVGQFSEKMSVITAPQSSPEYKEAFQRAASDSDNAIRALMGEEALIKMKNAAIRGETLE